MEEAHSPGRRVTGLRQTQKAVLAGRAERVFLAKDADPAPWPGWAAPAALRWAALPRRN